MQLQIASENTLLLTLGEEASPQVSALVQSAALATKRVMGKELIDLIPSYASLLIIYDPFLTDHFAVTRKIKFAMESLDAAQAEEGTAVILPVYYSPESGEDLEDLAERANMSIEEVIALHSGSDYRVYAIGFAPGFAYLGEVHERIAAPRLATPRLKVPRGAVAIADRQTAVYPSVSPGGWNLIGRCPVQMFNPSATPTMPVNVGDRVRFKPIGRTEFLELGGEIS